MHTDKGAGNLSIDSDRWAPPPLGLLLSLAEPSPSVPLVFGHVQALQMCQTLIWTGKRWTPMRSCRKRLRLLQPFALVPHSSK